MEKMVIRITELNSTKELGSLNLETGEITLTAQGTGFLRLPVSRHGVVTEHGYILGRVAPSKNGCVITVLDTGNGKLTLNTPEQESELLAFQEARQKFLDSL